MKVIDLLQRIANEDKIPNKIIYDEREYTYHDKEHGYCRHAYDNTYVCIDTEYYLFDILNDKVEIIEEDKKINKDIKWYLIDFQEQEKTKIAQINMNFKILREKLTEIIDYINGGTNGE